MIKTIIIDVDGVLTDGKVTYTSLGERNKNFHARDIRAIRELISKGYDVYLLTQSTWPATEEYAARTGATVAQAIDKYAWIHNNNIKNYIAVGDDVADIKMLDYATEKYCPNDADLAVALLPEMKQLETCGGCGVIAELVRHLS